MTELETLRHSCAHVMAHALKELFPKAKLGIGPPIEEGFYYDIDYEVPFVPEDLERIEKKMREIVDQDHLFKREVLNREAAKTLFKKMNEDYKLQIIDQVDPKEDISIYRDGDFVDLCRGPHVASTGKVRAFKLLSISGAYWRGSENNQMMQRIYGTAFFSQKELDEYLRLREEAKRRDHRKLGSELGLFSMQEDGGPGLIFYHPKGGLVRYLIEDFVRKEHLKRGYQFVVGPQILKSNVWVRSGHYDYYKENMFIFPVSTPHSTQKQEYAIKPMNCPAHMLIFRSEMRSYRDLPLRFFEMGNVCRNEKSGVLHGLLRVRNFTQDDAHIFCTPEQLEEEIVSVIDFVIEMLTTFGFDRYDIDLSTRPKDSIGTDEDWERATSALEGALQKKKLNYQVCREGGAFYGPKIDIRIKDALGRSWQCSTIQCDFALPERFDLEYGSSDGKKRRPVVLHRAILGSVERFMGTLIEHYAGAFPLWLSPVQVALIPISSVHEKIADEFLHRLRQNEIRVEKFPSTDTLGLRIRTAQKEKIPYMAVIGDKEAVSKTVSVRHRSQGDLGQVGCDQWIEQLKNEITLKRR